jgi:hypothetical protein
VPVAASRRCVTAHVDDVDEGDGRGRIDLVERQVGRIRREERPLAARGRQLADGRPEVAAHGGEVAVAEIPDQAPGLDAVDDDPGVAAVGRRRRQVAMSER